MTCSTSKFIINKLAGYLNESVLRSTDKCSNESKLPFSDKFTSMKDHSINWYLSRCILLICKNKSSLSFLSSTGITHTLLSFFKVPWLTSLFQKPPNNDSNIEKKFINENEIENLETKCVFCAILTELSSEDIFAQMLIRENAIHLLGSNLILQVNPECLCTQARKVLKALHCNIFRALKFLFGFERNRRLIKTLLPIDLMYFFLDLPNNERDLKAYVPITEKLYEILESSVSSCTFYECLRECDIYKEPSHYIRNYAMVELLGTGAYGRVYKAIKNYELLQHTEYAVKEVNTTQGAFGASRTERNKNIADIVNELKIIRQQLRHPNVVRYYRTFIEGEKLYIVMELIEGACLSEYITASFEKKRPLKSVWVWNVFLQLILALRYLHKEKAIVHRDLSANNVMISTESDRVTITDFGMAKQKLWNASSMHSNVGTLMYACPEIVQRLPYGERADIWSLGCLMYQMISLKPPFDGDSILSVANRIAKGVFIPLKEKMAEIFEPALYDDPQFEVAENVIEACLTVDSNLRPDILGIASLVPHLLMTNLDSVRQKIAIHSKTVGNLNSECSISTSQGLNFLGAGQINHSLILSQEEIVQGQSSPSGRFMGSLNTLSECNLWSPTGSCCSSRSTSATLAKRTNEHSQTLTNFEFYNSNIKHSLVSISEDKVKEIKDPMLNCLSLLQKLCFILNSPTVFKSPEKQNEPTQNKRILLSLARSYGRFLICQIHKAEFIKQEVSRLNSGLLDPAPLGKSGSFLSVDELCEYNPDDGIDPELEKNLSENSKISYWAVKFAIDNLTLESD